jgi:hypothetical protein
LTLKVGPVALLGSGETCLAGGRIFQIIARHLGQPLRAVILETPAGFELNSSSVAGRVADFLKSHLHNFDPQIDVIPARKRGSPFSPDDPQILQPLLQANLIFMGPGSPTYAVRQLGGSLAWDLVRARHRQGAALVFASAAVIAIGACVLPVYEIYKAGEDVKVVPGLDFFSDFNLLLSFVPHWNNTDGGDELDTGRCFIGIERFNQWCSLLPEGHTTIGLDEHTGMIVDFAARKCTIRGLGSVTLLRECNSRVIPAGKEFPIDELGDYQPPEDIQTGFSTLAGEMVSENAPNDFLEGVPNEIAVLLEKRRRARLHKQWVSADKIRQQLASLGWLVRDTPEGQKIIRQA